MLRSIVEEIYLKVEKKDSEIENKRKIKWQESCCSRRTTVQKKMEKKLPNKKKKLTELKIMSLWIERDH